MKKMGLNEIRTEFLNFFQEKDHLILKSYSLIPENDKSLLLINAGMAPLKDYFTGEKKMSKNRAASSQKCVRTADIENVGKTSRHGTFFEMLGNFSFGDYFKEEAISWAYEFLTDRLEIPKDMIWVTVYLDDDEAYNIWKNEIGMPEERILRFGKEDNFWELEQGPCGPCSEIYIDRGEKYGPEGKPGDPGDRYMEVWNLVFTQFDKTADGEYEKLSHPNIDTGMGLERITTVLEDCDNLFEVSLMRNIISRIEEISGKKYHENKKNDISIRIISDHARAVTFMVSDGIVPSNEGRGYVLRRLLRRASRHGKLLGIKGSFLTKVVEEVIKSYREAYPELLDDKDRIFKIILTEEDKFQETLDLGLNILEDLIYDMKEKGETVMSGDQAFKLYDTYGFPLELTEEILEDEGLSLDEEAFKKNMEAQRERSRSAFKRDSGFHESQDMDFSGLPKTIFTGYDEMETDSQVLALYLDDQRIDMLKSGQSGIMLVKETPFYGEGGGQIGDRGTFSGKNFSGNILDTKKTKDPYYLHEIELHEGSLKVGDRIRLSLDQDRRRDIMRNHSATHLLHQALRQVLGDHVHQAGSYVSDKSLRFDITHYEAISKEDLNRVEEIVNYQISKQDRVEVREMSLEESEEMGAIGLFEDKYQDRVRVVKMGDFSMELCGGTHVSNTSEVLIFKIKSESSVAAGVRRIEAETGRQVYRSMKEEEAELLRISEKLKTRPDELYRRLDLLLEERLELEREFKKLKQEKLQASTDEYIDQAKEIKGVKYLFLKLSDMNMDSLRDLGDKLRDKLGSGLVLLASTEDGKLKFTCQVTKDLVERGVHAGNIVKKAAQATGGNGGGRPDSASAGGKDISKIDQAFDEAKKQLEEMLG